MKKKVLIIEQHPMMRLFLHNYLSKYYEVRSFESFRAVFEDMDKIIYPDLIVAHFCAEGSEDYEYLKDLHLNIFLRDRPILMLTDKDNSLQRIESLKIGAKDSISKPFNPLELTERIELHTQTFDQMNSQRQLKVS